jgi:hypothetical protein
MRNLKASSLALVLALLFAAPVVAQNAPTADDSRVMSASFMDAALVGHASTADVQRAELSDLLSRSDVRELATMRGIDMEQVETAAAGLSDAQVMQVAPLVAKTAPMMAAQNMGTVTISVAALIIILLILILVS